jgi:hypothetical protein
MGTVHEGLYASMIIYRLILLRLNNVSDKSCRETHNEHYMFSNFSFENLAVCAVMWKTKIEADRTHMTIKHGA